ncbi:MAG: recombinase, partial [Janthinobacterium sp.]
MLAILERIDPYTSNIDLLVELFNSLRPKRPHDSATAIANVRTLRQLLKGNPAQARALHEYVLRVLAARRHASLYTDIGVLSNSGFFTELKRRIAYRMLPPALGDEYLNDALDQVLYLKTDYLWISNVPATDWLELFDVLTGDDIELAVGDGNIMLPGLLDAIRTLSYRVCAMGLEPELTRFHSEIEVFQSPFMVQNTEVNAYLDAYTKLLQGDIEHIEDARHLLVMLDQCDAVIAKIRKKALYQGTSIPLTYLLVALAQSIDRLRKLLFLVDTSGELPASSNVDIAAITVDATQDVLHPQPVSRRRAGAVALALELIRAHNHKYKVSDLFSDNI